MVRPGLRWRFTLACGLPPFQGLFVCYVVKELRNGDSVGTAP